ncbi:hypothetical protein EON65_13430 [archaeon]|nr:MAG: hypothetical protein EON65_13430 [archaeon]
MEGSAVQEMIGLQASLNAVLRSLGSQLWSNSTVLRFLDTAQTQSPFTTLKLQLMERKVKKNISILF